MRPIRATALALLVIGSLLLAFSATSPAVTLLVDGTTPSIRYQRLVDQFARHVPTPPGIVRLVLGRCPSYPHADGCSDVTGATPTIWLNTAHLHGVPEEPVSTLAHELGHVEIEHTFDDADRARFAMIWHRPVRGWWEALREPDASTLYFNFDNSPGGIQYGIDSEAGEWAAEAYRLCATEQWRSSFADSRMGYLPNFGWRSNDEASDLHATRAPVIATCGLIRSAAARGWR